jgi:hypothetical protein
MVFSLVSLRKMHFWEGYFLQWTQEGVRDSDITNVDHHAINLLAEKDKQIAELQAQLRECQLKLGITPTTSVASKAGDTMPMSKIRGRGLAKMKLISERSLKKPKSKRIVTATASAAADAADNQRATSPPEHRNEKAKKKGSKMAGVVSRSTVVGHRAQSPVSAASTAEQQASSGTSEQPATRSNGSQPPLSPAADDIRDEEAGLSQSEAGPLGSSNSEAKWRVGVKN